MSTNTKAIENSGGEGGRGVDGKTVEPSSMMTNALQTKTYMLALGSLVTTMGSFLTVLETKQQQR